jgi:hypothetical protein
MEKIKANKTKIIHLESPHKIKPYSKTQLVKIYAPISLYVLNKWLKAIQQETGPIIGSMLNTKQMEIFVRHYGLPHEVVIVPNDEMKKAA